MASDADWVEAWNLFDRPPRTGQLSKDKVKVCIRGVGRLYTESELDALLQPYPDTMTKEQYLEAVKKEYTAPDHSILTAISAFDGKERGEASEGDVAGMLGSGTEPLPPELVSRVLRGAAFEQGKISNEALAKFLEMGWKDIEPALEDVLACS
eukprot:TRINITY_DN29727_c0_g1_i1.p2 TRINITY_DN29727_c0_g1~~TRINITY_DN29727_c0_g1_i1.p2  ORF type:complete len:153 (+),score=44.64 TRINITY_DN29727_c0_g1_i1:55-513(+)